MKKRFFPVLISALLLPSCAYLQTHKNIEEMGCSYEGSELTPENIRLHSRGGQWYISAPQGNYSKTYPVIHDEVYDTDENAPTYTLLGDATGRAYFPISAGTAACLRRQDGYALTNALVAEILASQQESCTELRGSSTHPIRAEVKAGEHPSIIIQSRTPESPSTFTKVLSTLDMCTVDAIGTAAYNVAMPIMAPFRFFGEFTQNF